MKKIENALYRVTLLAWMKIHLVIHVSNLKPYQPNLDDDRYNAAVRPDIDLEHLDEKEVEEILVVRVRKVGKPA